jgi:hypothetical protein
MSLSDFIVPSLHKNQWWVFYGYFVRAVFKRCFAGVSGILSMVLPGPVTLVSSPSK